MRQLHENMHVPTAEELNDAHVWFETYEPRALFYRAATDLVQRALNRDSDLTLAEAVGVLLQTWNAAYYRFHGRFSARHFQDIDRLLQEHDGRLRAFRKTSLDALSGDDAPLVKRTFEEFEGVLGPVGAAKCLHLLAPRFFPLWDRGIAAGYGLSLGQKGLNAERYWGFMSKVREQCQRLGCELGPNPLKALDEYNYWKYSRRDRSASAAGREANTP